VLIFSAKKIHDLSMGGGLAKRTLFHPGLNILIKTPQYNNIQDYVVQITNEWLTQYVCEVPMLQHFIAF